MKVLIVTGGDAPNGDFIKQIITEFQPDHIIAADSGADILFDNGIMPNILLGDFDSIRFDAYNYYIDKCDIIPLLKEKDETDTQIAIQKAKELNATEILVLGATGGRLDHTIANLYLLKKAQSLGMNCCILDETQQIFLIENIKKFYGLKGIRLSIFPFSDRVTGIKTTGFHYPLYDETFIMGDVRGISNLIIDEYASIEVESGTLLTILESNL